MKPDLTTFLRLLRTELTATAFAEFYSDRERFWNATNAAIARAEQKFNANLKEAADESA